GRVADGAPSPPLGARLARGSLVLGPAGACGHAREALLPLLPGLRAARARALARRAGARSADGAPLDRGPRLRLARAPTGRDPGSACGTPGERSLAHGFRASPLAHRAERGGRSSEERIPAAASHGAARSAAGVGLGRRHARAAAGLSPRSMA